MTLKDVLAAVGHEVLAQEAEGPPSQSAIRSPEEGYGLLVIALSDVFAEVRAGAGDGPEAREKATRLAATAVRYVVDITG